MSDYTVDVNNVNEPTISRFAYKMAEEMRALKAKMQEVIAASTVPTGQVVAMARTSEPLGWKIIPANMHNASPKVGNDSSASDYLKGEVYKNLFFALWTDPGIAMFSISGASASRGVSAISDWNAGASLSLPAMAGRVLAAATIDGGASGVTVGAKTHTLAIAEIPAHSHTLRVGGGGSNNRADLNGNQNNEVEIGDQTTASSGGGQAHNNMQPTYYINYFIKI